MRRPRWKRYAAAGALALALLGLAGVRPAEARVNWCLQAWQGCECFFVSTCNVPNNYCQGNPLGFPCVTIIEESPQP